MRLREFGYNINEADASKEIDYNDPAWDEKVLSIKQKAELAKILKSKGKEPKVRWNPETRQYYVDYIDTDDDKSQLKEITKQGVAEGVGQPKGAGQALQSLKNLALMKSTLTFPQLRQAGRESMITDAMNAAIALEQSYMANKQQGNAMFVRALRDEIDNFKKGYPINSSMPDDDGYAPELGDLLQGRLGKLNFQQGVAEGLTEMDKSSINCSHPKGFSQRAHCAGKQKHNESIEMEMVCEDCGMCQSHGSLNEIAKGAKDANGVTKCWPGKHAEGTKTGKNGGQVRNCVPNESVAEDQLDELSKDTLRNYVRAQPARIKGPAGLATTNNQKAARIVDPVTGDIRRAMDKYKDPEYGQQRPRLPEDSLAAMRRLAGVTTPAPAAVPNGLRQYRHMPTAVQPR